VEAVGLWGAARGRWEMGGNLSILASWREAKGWADEIGSRPLRSRRGDAKRGGIGELAEEGG
jgi:hypothetical protein